MGETLRTKLLQSIPWIGKQPEPTKFEERMLLQLHDKGATKANIIRTFAMLAGEPGAIDPAVSERHRRFFPAQPEHTLFVYFAGHGWSYGGRHYLIPYDFEVVRNSNGSVDMERALGTALSDEELTRALANIDARNLILILDTCYAEQALAAERWQRGPFNMSGLAQLAFEKQMVILSASQATQAAIEADVYGHGLLAHALIGLGIAKGQADHSPKDGSVTLSEWLSFGVQKVPALFRSLASESHRGLQLTATESAVQRPVLFDQRPGLPDTLFLDISSPLPSRGTHYLR